MSKKSKGKRVGEGLLKLLPFVLFFCALILFSLFLFNTVLEETAYFSLFVGERVYADSEEQAGDFVPGAATDTLPQIAYGTQFAQLNVEGWDIKNIAVYLGNDKSILKKAAGMSFASGFPGQGQRVIISSHVTREFAELEDTPIGAVVTIETLYGPYEYRVVDKRSFSGTERSLLTPSTLYGEQLILYTCYPRDNGGHRRTERCALICEKISGLELVG
ncbi:MAG: sortase [Clostridia bacterium]|nr:sortase [Clostridia bacterium]